MVSVIFSDIQIYLPCVPHLLEEDETRTHVRVDESGSQINP